MRGCIFIDDSDRKELLEYMQKTAKQKLALQIIDRRARRNKSTIIVSRYHLKYFTMLDSFKEVAGIISENITRPKNLKVIEFFK